MRLDWHIAPTQQPLLGWTDFHWRQLVLVGTNSRGQPFSMGEAIATPSRRRKNTDEQTLDRVELCGPTGNRAVTAYPETMADATREIPALIERLGGLMRVD